MRKGLVNLLGAIPRRYGRIIASGTYVPQIDGLRFLAIMQVVVFHAALRGERALGLGHYGRDGALAYFPNGAAGVELFFFISGYIIAFPFLAGHAPSLKQFFKRRLLRLEPPYILALSICLLLLVASGYHPADAPSFNKSSIPLWQSFLASIVYCHGILFQAPPRLNPPLWSLEIEIQFYILAPFLLAAYLAIGERRRRLRVGAVLLVVAIVGQAALAGDGFMNFFLPSHFYAFWLGILFCDQAVANDPFKAPARHRYDLALIAGLLIFLVSASLFYAFTSIAAVAATLAMRASGIALIYVGASRGVIGRKLFGAPWITFIGGACYSIYLTHVPLLQAASVVAFHVIHPATVLQAAILGPVMLVPVVVAVGLIYYLLVERPCMRRDWPQRLLATVQGFLRPRQPWSEPEAVATASGQERGA